MFKKSLLNLKKNSSVSGFESIFILKNKKLLENFFLSFITPLCNKPIRDQFFFFFLLLSQLTNVKRGAADQNLNLKLKFLNIKKLSIVGIEPTTFRLSNDCSTF